MLFSWKLVDGLENVEYEDPPSHTVGIANATDAQTNLSDQGLNCGGLPCTSRLHIPTV